MQFTKGAGLIELNGLEEISHLKNYTLIRPLLNYSKDDLLKYLNNSNIKYFVDKSNFEDKYKRNYFRNNFSNQLLDEYKEGIKKSFLYLKNDIKSLNINNKPIISIGELEVFKAHKDNNKNIRLIDKSLKQRGYIISANQRNEILKQKEIVIGEFSISIVDTYIWISPHSNQTMDKKFKDLCRVNKIPKKNRAYLKEINLDVVEIKGLLV